ncbi:glutathionylspermidine synthase family protein [Anaerococcus hydrogenalis]|uniref:Uncharacterized protein n=1 Tax=Anaerococcus hydrogenalis ACS-025-V-Sch4 TaxID=879306 RepID=F0H116_9FIRM|nr:glutathionylspermidine synthase family protein [Anaerococcus hydrogenalis]EGC83793.1 hypothetical protein HMPREF9246_1896 [Anaerococcus hydrogenalis ACS-025-V-Sch4]
MINDQIKIDYEKIINENYQEYKKEYEKLLNNRKEYGATYKEEEIPTLYDAYFYSQEDYKLYDDMIDTFMSIVEKVTKEYVENESYRKLFALDPLTEKLILKDPGYNISTPIARFDVMYDGREDYKFCELNTDGSSAMLEDKSLADLMKETKAIEKLKEKYVIDHTDLLQSLVDSIEVLYYKTKKLKKK